MNSITITGTLGRDSELKSLPSGTQVLEFSVAVNDGFGDKKKTYWWKCKLFGDRAAKLEQYFLKGTRLLIQGSPELREYEKKDGSKGMSAEIFVRDFDFFGGKQEATEAPAKAKVPAGLEDAFDGADDNDQVPF